MARQARIAVTLVLGAALGLSACGRKGPLEQPGTPPGAQKEAPPGTPEPEAKPDTLKRPTPTPTAKP